jgi:hypothetical protein
MFSIKVFFESVPDQFKKTCGGNCNLAVKTKLLKTPAFAGTKLGTEFLNYNDIKEENANKRGAVRPTQRRKVTFL